MPKGVEPFFPSSWGPVFGMRKGGDVPPSGIPTSFSTPCGRSENAGSSAMRVALDAMGGDFAPGPIVAGACEAVGDLPELTVVLVGDRERIEAELAKAPGAPRDRMPIVHASQAIGMEEKPVEALRRKRDNS